MWNNSNRVWKLACALLLVTLSGCQREHVANESQATRLKRFTDRFKPELKDDVSSVDKMHVQIGDFAPDISGPDIEGNPFKLSDYRGKVVLLTYWANW